MSLYDSMNEICTDLLIVFHEKLSKSFVLLVAVWAIESRTLEASPHDPRLSRLSIILYYHEYTSNHFRFEIYDIFICFTS